MAELPDSEKLSHAEVRYESSSKHSGEFCAGCKHFISGRSQNAPDRCEHVKSPISPRAWCMKYEAKK